MVDTFYDSVFWVIAMLVKIIETMPKENITNGKQGLRRIRN